MEFFDLNIPYDLSPAGKQMRTKMVFNCMDLGYTGVAYNHTVNGMMSDRDRCSIHTLTVSSITSLFSLSPSFASSVRFHRELLGVSASSPFRQYTRLTIVVETPAQALAINGGNPVLKTYDIIGVRPMNQTAFDQACEKLEVDIVVFDFTDKLPFRLKQHVVSAAVKRGVCFEITYSDLLGDNQVKRQAICTAKMLLGWTRGKNIIFSSGAPSAAELRGPFDVANLSCLLGLSQEQAKKTISKNCSKILCNALRRKNFFKEAIRVEHLTSEKQFSDELLKWDALSSGEADLLLDDILKSFSALSEGKQIPKAIDFSSITDGALDQFHIPKENTSGPLDDQFYITKENASGPLDDQFYITKENTSAPLPNDEFDILKENSSVLLIENQFDNMKEDSTGFEVASEKISNNVESSDLPMEERRNVDTALQIDMQRDASCSPSSAEVTETPLKDSVISNGSNDDDAIGKDFWENGAAFSPFLGKEKAKQASRQRSMLFPLKRLLNPLTSKNVKKLKRTQILR